MAYVERDQDGNVTGIYALPQGFTTEQLPDDHPDVVDFRNQPDPPPPITTAEVVAALDEIATALPPASRAKLDALLARP